MAPTLSAIELNHTAQTPWQGTRRRRVFRSSILACASLVAVLGSLTAADDLVGQEHIRFVSRPAGQLIGRQVQLLEDARGRASLEDVMANPGWKRSSSDVPNFAFSDSVYWLRFALEISSDTPRNILLELAYPLHDYVDVFVVRGRQHEQFQTGDRRPVSQRPVWHPNYLFPINVRTGETPQVYVRVASHDGAHEPLRLFLWSPEAFQAFDRLRSSLFWAGLGGLTLIAFYHLFLYASLRDVSFLIFVGVLLTKIAFYLCYEGWSPLLFWPEQGWWANHVHPVVIAVSEMSLCLFARSYLNTAKESRAWHAALTVLAAAWALSLFAGLLLPFSIAIRISILLLALTNPAFVAMGLHLTIRGHRSARYFLIAIVTFVLGTIILILKGSAVVPSTVFTDNAGLMGSVSFAVLLAFGLADRINTLRAEKDHARQLALDIERRSNQELADANSQLQRLDQLKDDFLANTSHELRTPLHGIIGLSESMLSGSDGRLNPHLKENLQLIASSGRRLSSLVDDVLDFSRLRHEDLVLRRGPVDVSVAIDMVLALSQPMVAGKPVELIHDRGQLPPVYADENRLQQILHNLIGNATKFTRAGSVVVSAAVSDPDATHGPRMLEVSVADTGIGIPADKHATIFEYFTQADTSVARQYGGTGLGLSITKRLVELHGGAIRLESAPGAGSCFFFTLPVYGEQPAISSAAPQPAGSGPVDLTKHSAARPLGAQAELPATKLADAPRGSGTSGVRTLIVDDDPVNLRVLQNHLELEGHAVAIARDGREALNLLEGDAPFDLVLLDVMMPGLSGYEVCRIMRERLSESELPVILLTAKNRIEDLLTGLESGANDYLAKPFDLQELSARVRTMLRLKQAARFQSDLASIQSELELARELQNSLLPSGVPEVSGLRIGAHYRSMIKVGGDYYDFFSDGTNLGVLMADVSGHGVPAAMIVSIVKIAFWFQRKNASAPGTVLEGINATLCGNIGKEFVTGCYAWIDGHERRLVCANAGHPPLLIWSRRENEISQMRPFGRILGFRPDQSYEIEEAPLEPGDRVLLYTDGVIEARNPSGEAFGQERLERTLAEHAAEDPKSLCDSLRNELENWSRAEAPEDDVTLVVVELTG